MVTWQNEFNERYTSPRVENITVGFSGVDPNSLASTLSDEQLAIVTNLILTYLSKLTIKIDSGNIDPNEPPPEAQPVTLKPSEIPHEMLDGILGGNANGHYHLTDEELAKLHEYPEIENLNTLLKHEELPDLQGGENGAHYHLTQAELEKLHSLVNTLVPEEDSNIVTITYPVPDHEQLINLKGGTTNEHYHFTLSEWSKLLKVLNVLFPDGATEPKFPSVPSNPSGDDPSSGGEDEVDWGGLPKGTPPTWTMNSLPSGYTAPDYVSMMYFGGVPITKTTVRNELVVDMQTSGTSRALMRTTNLSTWNKMIGLASGSTTITSSLGKVTGRIIDYLLLYGNNRQQLYIMYQTTLDDVSTRYAYTLATNTDTLLSLQGITNNSAGSSYWVAGCYSPDLDIAIFVTYDGGVTCVQNNKGLTKPTSYKNISCGLTDVNGGAAAWSPDAKIFCVAANSKKVAISSDGVNWQTYTVNHSFTRMEYRADLGCLFAREYDENLFYVSGDGKNWSKLNNTPPPISGAARPIAYAPELGWYCAVGGSGKSAYFSKDLEHWRETTVTNGTDINMGCVIWAGGSINKFVLMPRSGSYYYTFDPATWKD